MMRSSYPRLLAGVLALSAVGLGACAPESAYRHTALVPAARPLAWDGQAARAGTVRVEGTVSESRVHENLSPREHDTALQVATTVLEGAATVAPIEGLEVGARYARSESRWAKPSAVGAMPLPSPDAIEGFGPEVRLQIPVSRERGVSLGFAGNVMSYSMPFAEWARTGQDQPGGPLCAPSPRCVDGYRPANGGTENHFTFSVGFMPSWAIGPGGKYGRVVGLLGAHTGFKNDGFTEQPSKKSTVEDAGLVGLIGAGYGASIDFVRVSFLVWKPLTGAGSPVDYGLGGLLTAGLDLPLWGGAAP